MEIKSGSYIRKLVITGALGALTVFLGVTRLGLIPWFTGASITIMHIPAIIGAIVEGPFVALGIGAIFGIVTLFQANIPNGPVDILFRDPLVSVLPRILFPLVTWAVFFLVSKWKKLPAIVIASVIGTLVHSALVLGMIGLTKGSGLLVGAAPGTSLWMLLGGIFLANGIPEAIAAGILTTLIVTAWTGISSGKNKSKLSGEK